MHYARSLALPSYSMDVINSWPLQCRSDFQQPHIPVLSKVHVKVEEGMKCGCVMR